MQEVIGGPVWPEIQACAIVGSLDAAASLLFGFRHRKSYLLFHPLHRQSCRILAAAGRYICPVLLEDVGTQWSPIHACWWCRYSDNCSLIKAWFESSWPRYSAHVHCQEAAARMKHPQPGQIWSIIHHFDLSLHSLTIHYAIKNSTSYNATTHWAVEESFCS